jgi:hypothetical protein
MPDAIAPAAGKTILIEAFPAPLHHRIKIAAALEGVTMKGWIIDRLTRAVDAAEKARGRKQAKV